MGQHCGRTCRMNCCSGVPSVGDKPWGSVGALQRHLQVYFVYSETGKYNFDEFWVQFPSPSLRIIDSQFIFSVTVQHQTRFFIIMREYFIFLHPIFYFLKLSHHYFIPKHTFTMRGSPQYRHNHEASSDIKIPHNCALLGCYTAQ